MSAPPSPPPSGNAETGGAAEPPPSRRATADGGAPEARGGAAPVWPAATPPEAGRSAAVQTPLTAPAAASTVSTAGAPRAVAAVPSPPSLPRGAARDHPSGVRAPARASLTVTLATPAAVDGRPQADAAHRAGRSRPSRPSGGPARGVAGDARRAASWVLTAPSGAGGTRGRDPVAAACAAAGFDADTLARWARPLHMWPGAYVGPIVSGVLAAAAHRLGDAVARHGGGGSWHAAYAMDCWRANADHALRECRRVVDARASVMGVVAQMRAVTEVAAAERTPAAAMSAPVVTTSLSSQLSRLVATEDGVARSARWVLANAPPAVDALPPGVGRAERPPGAVSSLFAFYARSGRSPPPSLPTVAGRMLAGGHAVPPFLFFAGLALAARAVVAGTDGLTVTAATGGRLLAAGVAVAADGGRWGAKKHGDAAWAAAGVTADDEREVLGWTFGQLVWADVAVMDEVDVAAWAHVVAVLHDVYGHGRSR
ncbi:hypothetical protein BU14_0415s0003 [Porphyra umbilicalis]|uniref:Uncharacterized protein n=1 Tax=Porphyra umbilicalis TaxID=2786 RepID=A0A1X6NVL7_PORUM|nr:hypothetical protein BU14_0415s0003 [Porphyra umbilicalis]|eukprot:OSX72658.1 hypothetical protein BU14_0415s0003 [Porphyra umbilicalis]